MSAKYSQLKQAEEGVDDVSANREPSSFATSSSSRSPAIVTVALQKPDKANPIGIVWHTTKRRVGTARLQEIKILRIIPMGIAACASPDLKPGMKLLRINNVDFQCGNKNADDAVSLIKDLASAMTIVVASSSNTYYSTVLAPISFVDVKDSSKSSGEEEGKDDDEDDEDSAEAAKADVEEGKGETDSNRMKAKPSFGIQFLSTTGRDITVKSIDTNSPFAIIGTMTRNHNGRRRKLSVGDTIVRINDMDCTTAHSLGDVDDGDESLLQKVENLMDKLASDGSGVTIYFTSEWYLASTSSVSSRRLSVNHHNDGHRSGMVADSRDDDGHRVWGTQTYHGSQTTLFSCICCLFCGCISSIIVCCNPFDKRRVYRVNNRIYTSSGQRVGTTGDGIEFDRDATAALLPSSSQSSAMIDTDKQITVLVVAGGAGFFLTVIGYLLMTTAPVDPNDPPS